MAIASFLSYALRRRPYWIIRVFGENVDKAHLLGNFSTVNGRPGIFFCVWLWVELISVSVSRGLDKYTMHVFTVNFRFLDLIEEFFRDASHTEFANTTSGGQPRDHTIKLAAFVSSEAGKRGFYLPPTYLPVSLYLSVYLSIYSLLFLPLFPLHISSAPSCLLSPCPSSHLLWFLFSHFFQ